MQGLELSRLFYEECGKPMLEKDFKEWIPYLAVGLVGCGSECYGFDDELSKDHDFEPGFCLFLPSESILDRKVAFQLERAYSKLPKTFRGYERNPMNPVGGNRHGVLRLEEFYKEKVGHPDGTLTTHEWLTMPEHFLAEATNGEVFADPFGEFSRIREQLRQMPEEIRLKKLAGNLLMMAQSGLYNFHRCLSHGESGAAQLSLFHFASCGIQTIFLLNRTYLPYYKWSFRALRELPTLGHLADSFEFLLTTDNGTENVQLKKAVLEDLSTVLLQELKKENLIPEDISTVDKAAYFINDAIDDEEIRNLSIFASV